MDISIAVIPRAFLYVFWNLRVTKSCQSTQFSTEQSTQWARATLPEYLEFLAIPNNASIAQDIQHNADWLQNAFTRRGLQVQQLPNQGKPMLYAQWPTLSPHASTVLFYMHLDGQPVVPHPALRLPQVLATWVMGKGGRAVRTRERDFGNVGVIHQRRPGFMTEPRDLRAKHGRRLERPGPHRARHCTECGPRVCRHTGPACRSTDHRRDQRSVR